MQILHKSVEFNFTDSHEKSTVESVVRNTYRKSWRLHGHARRSVEKITIRGRMLVYNSSSFVTSSFCIGVAFSLAALDSTLMLKVMLKNMFLGSKAADRWLLNPKKNIFLSITLSINVESRVARENVTPIRNVDVTKEC